MLPYPLPTAKQTATGTTYTSTNWKVAGKQNIDNNRSSDSTGASKVTTSNSAATALASAPSSLHHVDAQKLKRKRPFMAFKWNKVKESLTEIGSTMNRGLRLPKTPEKPTFANAYTSGYSDHVPLRPSRPAPLPHPREILRDVKADKLERDLRAFEEFEASQRRNQQASHDSNNEEGRENMEEAIVETGWDWDGRQFRLQQPLGPVVKISAPPRTHRKQHSGPSNPGPTIHEDDEECDSPFADRKQSVQTRENLNLPRGPDRSQYRASMLLEQARCENGWTPAQLLDNYGGGWEPGHDTPQHEPLDLLDQAMVKTNELLRTPRQQHEAYPLVPSPSSVYSTRLTEEKSDSLPHNLNSASDFAPHPTYDAYFLLSSPPPSPELKIPSKTQSLVRPPRTSSLPSTRTSREDSQSWSDRHGATQRSAEGSARTSSDRERSAVAIWQTSTTAVRGTDGFWQNPVNFSPMIVDPRMRPPNYSRWNAQQCGGWF